MSLQLSFAARCAPRRGAALMVATGAAVLLALAPAAEARTVTIRSTGRTVDLKRGDTLKVRLSEDSAQGFHWRVVKRPAFLRLVRLQYDPAAQDPADAGIAPGPGIRTFTFAVRKNGIGTLRLDYRHGTATPVRAFTVKLR